MSFQFKAFCLIAVVVCCALSQGASAQMSLISQDRYLQGHEMVVATMFGGGTSYEDPVTTTAASDFGTFTAGTLGGTNYQNSSVTGNAFNIEGWSAESDQQYQGMVYDENRYWGVSHTSFTFQLSSPMSYQYTPQQFGGGTHMEDSTLSGGPSNQNIDLSSANASGGVLSAGTWTITAESNGEDLGNSNGFAYDFTLALTPEPSMGLALLLILPSLVGRRRIAAMAH